MNQLRYKGGRQIPENVLKALKYIGKVGVITRPAWNTLFGKGNERWRRRQLLNLEDYGVLKKHSCNVQTDTWVLTNWSRLLLTSNGFSCVSPVPPHLIEHDEVVGRSLFILKETGHCSKWITERELKALNTNAYIVQKKDKDVKYPDAVFRILEAASKTVALEYERTGKSMFRYRSILRQYARIEGIDQIIYVTEDDTIKARIKKVLLNLGDRALMSRIGFVNGHEWKSNPMTAKVENAGRITPFEKYFL